MMLKQGPRKVTVQWQVPEATAQGVVTLLQTGVRIDELTAFPQDIQFVEARVLDEAPAARPGHRIVEAVYESPSR